MYPADHGCMCVRNSAVRRALWLQSIAFVVVFVKHDVYTNAVTSISLVSFV